MKVCSLCEKEKPDYEFTRGFYCRDCKLEYNRNWYLKNKEKSHQKYLQERKDRLKYGKEYYLKNIDKIKEYYRKRYLKNKKKLILQMQEYQKLRKKRDPYFKLNHRISGKIRSCLNGNKIDFSWEDVVGYNLNELTKHLEKQFQPGMSWKNYGEWHIDHIIPLSVFNFTKPEHIDFKRCWALSNLQPLWKLENCKKSNKLEKPFQPCLAL